MCGNINTCWSIAFLISCVDCSTLFLAVQPDLCYFKSRPVKGTKAVVPVVLLDSFILVLQLWTVMLLSDLVSLIIRLTSHHAPIKIFCFPVCSPTTVIRLRIIFPLNTVFIPEIVPSRSWCWITPAWQTVDKAESRWVAERHSRCVGSQDEHVNIRNWAGERKLQLSPLDGDCALPCLIYC